MAFFLQNGHFWTIFICFNAKGNCPKHPKGEGYCQTTFFGEGGGGGPFDQTWGWWMNFTDNGGGDIVSLIYSFIYLFIFGRGTLSQVLCPSK